MATIKLNEYSVDLSYKLQDPVADYSGNGRRYTSVHRHKYLKEGYRQLIKHLLIFTPKLIRKVFNNFYQYRTGLTDNSGKISFNIFPGEVYELYIKPFNTEKWELADYVEQMDWMTVKTGQNEFYVPDLNKKDYYWTVIKAGTTVPPKIEILPAVKYDYMVTLREAMIFPEHSLVAEDEDIDIKEEFSDIMINFGASAAWFELGKADMGKVFFDKAELSLRRLSELQIKKEKENEISED